MSDFKPAPLIQVWQTVTRLLWKRRGPGSLDQYMTDRWVSTGESTSHEASGDTTMDADLKLCELQHRIDELLADNDSMREECWSKDQAILAMAEKLSELEGLRK